jgi:hypothetical protein
VGAAVHALISFPPGSRVLERSPAAAVMRARGAQTGDLDGGVMVLALGSDPRRSRANL